MIFWFDDKIPINRYPHRTHFILSDRAKVSNMSVPQEVIHTKIESLLAKLKIQSEIERKESQEKVANDNNNSNNKARIKRVSTASPRPVKGM